MTGKVVIEVENLSKFYRLGTIGGGTLREDLARWWAKTRGRPDPLLKIGEQDHGNREGEHLWALRDVSFQVREGEVLGVIGRNGAGKSTLLKILSRITAPTSGKAVIRGRVGSLLEVGTGFHPELTGRENIYLNGAILGMKRAEITSKLEEIVDFAEMNRFIDTPVKRYSSGMTVRLAFAVAAHLEPEILIVDEVLAVGDANFQKKCLGKMKAVSSEGRTILFVSHNMSAVKSLCGQSMVMKQGTIAFKGATDDALPIYLDSEKSVAKGIVEIDSSRASIANNRVVRVILSALIQTGAPARLIVEFDRPVSATDARFSILLSDNEHRPVLLATTEQTVEEDFWRTSPTTIELLIDRLPLTAGMYGVTLFLESGKDVDFWLESAFVLDVVDGPFYERAQNLPHGWRNQMCLVDHRWSCISGAE
jgi:lipopolysaccharide transport system ATP-binding protein